MPTDVAYSVKTYAHLCIVGVRLKRVKAKTREFPPLFRPPAYPNLVRKLVRQQLPRIRAAADRDDDVLFTVEHVGHR